MEKYVINGGRRISGSVKMESAKNALLPLIAASLLTNEQTVIVDCAPIRDVKSMIKILSYLGVKAHFENCALIINPAGLDSYCIPYELSKELRSSTYMLGALLSSVGNACLCYPGGCKIGARPLDMHINALKALGAKITDTGECLECSATKLKGNKIQFPFPSVGATVNAMLGAVKAKGVTTITNAAKEPEIVDLAQFLTKMGAKIHGAGGHTIVVEGVDKLRGVCYKPVCDRIEAGTFLIAAAITAGEIEIINAKAQNILPLINNFLNNTCKVIVNNDIIYLKCERRLNAFSFDTGPYPEFPTDLQAQTMALCAVSKGSSVIRENVFEARFAHVKELNKMGANININGNVAYVNGVNRLHGAHLNATDLRGGAALALAALNAEGKSTINGVRYIERGYSDFDKKLASLNVDIKKKK